MNAAITRSCAPAPSIVAALQRLLRPLVRIMLAKGITYPFLAELLKSVYVKVATEEFSLSVKRQTDSRISLLTGVHRKDVKRLSEQSDIDNHLPSSISLGAQLVGLWVSQSKYLNAHRHPKPLPRLASNGAPSFEGLVQSVSKDIRPRAVLDEWLRLGVAHLDTEDRVCLNVDAFIPEQGFDEKAYYFGQNLHDHMAAAVHNLLGQSPPLLERSVYFERLSPASVEELAALSKELGMRALQDIHRRAVKLERRDVKKQDANMRMNFGIYYFSVPVNTELNEKRGGL